MTELQHRRELAYLNSPVHNPASPSSIANNLVLGSKASVYFTPTETTEQMLQLSPIHINYISESYDDPLEYLNKNPYANTPLFNTIKSEVILERIDDDSPTTSENMTIDAITESTAMIGENNSSNEDNCSKDIEMQYYPSEGSERKDRNSKEFYYSTENVHEIKPNASKKYSLLSSYREIPSFLCTEVRDSIKMNDAKAVADKTISKSSAVVDESIDLANPCHSRHAVSLVNLNDCTKLQTSTSLPEILSQ